MSSAMRHALCAKRQGYAVWAATLLFLVLGILTPARGQESVQMSIASAQAAEARHRAATTVGYYNLKLGPTAWNFGMGMGVDYNSNVNNTESNPEADFIIRPQINTRMLWPVSELNSINLALGLGYSAYVKTPNNDRAFITPGSELSFDLYVGDFWINLHDRFSISENTYQNPSVAGSGNYSQFQNALGVATTCDLNKAIVQAGYDHLNYDSLNGNNQNSGGQQSGYSEVLSTSAGYKLKPGMLLGVELGDSLINYTTTTASYPSANQWNLGGFYDTPVSEYIHFTIHAGYTMYTPQSSGATTGSTNFGGMYAELDITHRLNQYMSYSLSGGRTLTTTLGSGAIEQYFVRWGANWQIVRKVSLGTTFSYANGTDLYVGGETYDQYGPGISLNRTITQKLSSSLGYQVYWRTSNQANRNYTVNVVSLNLNYTF